MKVTGLCSICERPGILFSCALCGSIVCERHIDGRTAVCSACGGGRVPGRSA